jgi:hypothetical protein
MRCDLTASAMLGHQQNDERSATGGCAGGLPIFNFLFFSIIFEVANRMRRSLRLRKRINEFTENQGLNKGDQI